MDSGGKPEKAERKWLAFLGRNRNWFIRQAGDFSNPTPRKGRYLRCWENLTDREKKEYRAYRMSHRLLRTADKEIADDYLNMRIKTIADEYGASQEIIQ